MNLVDFSRFQQREPWRTAGLFPTRDFPATPGLAGKLGLIRNALSTKDLRYRKMAKPYNLVTIDDRTLR